MLSLEWQQLVMIVVGFALMYLVIFKNYEPNLLITRGFGTILANILFSSAVPHIAGDHLMEGALSMLFNTGIANELFSLLIFIAVGAICDFTPLLTNPMMFIFGLTAQAGIFLTMSLALLMGFDLHEAASKGIIGAADSLTSIYVSNYFAPHLLAPISIAAYTYMAMVQLIQLPVIKLMTSKMERRMKMSYAQREVSRKVLILFPIAVTLLSGFIAPASLALIGFLMFGNLQRVNGVTERLSQAAQYELANIVTILLGLSISVTMTVEKFVNKTTLLMIGMGLVAFTIDTADRVLSAKILNVFLPGHRKVNPMIGADGINAFPMSSRVVQRLRSPDILAQF